MEHHIPTHRCFGEWKYLMVDNGKECQGMQYPGNEKFLPVDENTWGQVSVQWRLDFSGGRRETQPLSGGLVVCKSLDRLFQLSKWVVFGMIVLNAFVIIDHQISIYMKRATSWSMFLPKLKHIWKYLPFEKGKEKHAIEKTTSNQVVTLANF